jgi:hypothetical protein
MKSGGEMTRIEEQRLSDSRINGFCEGLTGDEMSKGIYWWLGADIVLGSTQAAATSSNPLVSRDRLAAATAILSPMQPWGKNILMVGRLAIDKNAPPQTFHKWWRKARTALWNPFFDDMDRLATGPKVNAFYRALKGEGDAVVVDRWILRIVYPDDRGYPARVRRITQSIQRAAMLEQVTPRELQAAMWLKVRGG